MMSLLVSAMLFRTRSPVCARIQVEIRHRMAVSSAHSAGGGYAGGEGSAKENDSSELWDEDGHRGSTVVPGTAYYVATPIGNLEDITLRAIRTLREVDVIASEDTRVTSALLRALKIPPKKHPLVSHHDKNLAASVPRLASLLASGMSVAVVSDAGTPGISDPGLALATECAARGLPTVPIPGPCAAVAALSVAGVGATEFVFAGFIARGGKSRRTKVTGLSTESRAVVSSLSHLP